MLTNQMMGPMTPSLLTFLGPVVERYAVNTEPERLFTAGSTGISWGRCCARVPSCPPKRPRSMGARGLRMQDFSSSAYWNKVYASDEDGGAFDGEHVSEWHVDGELMVEAVDRLLGDGSVATWKEELAVLNVGCGKSTLWESMYDHGWRNITNIDFSTTCIEQGRQSRSSRSRPGVRWIVMDACSMAFEDDSFDVAVDKGTMDAIACSEAFDWCLPRMARGIVRVLRPGGTWVCVSFTPPKIAMPLLDCEEWSVHVERLESFWMYVGRKPFTARPEGLD